MSSPACAWPERASPKWPVTVPFTGAPIGPLVQPPAAGADGGAGDTDGAGFVAEPLGPAEPLEPEDDPLDPDPLDPDDPEDDPDDDPPPDREDPPEPSPWATRPVPSGEAALESAPSDSRSTTSRSDARDGAVAAVPRAPDSS